jgi:hypothetical protein
MACKNGRFFSSAPPSAKRKFLSSNKVRHIITPATIEPAAGGRTVPRLVGRSRERRVWENVFGFVCVEGTIHIIFQRFKGIKGYTVRLSGFTS